MDEEIETRAGEIGEMTGVEWYSTQPRILSSSPSLGALAGALAKAQGAMKEASKTQRNTFYNAEYADYADIWRVAQQPLADNEIAAIHCPRSTETTAGVTSMLVHSSGEWMSATLMLPVPINDKGNRPANQHGAVISYAKRYCMQAMCNIAADEDNDLQEQEPLLNPEQVSAIMKRLEAIDGQRTVTAFCKRFGVATLNQIPLSNYDAAISAIEKREAQKEKKDG